MVSVPDGGLEVVLDELVYHAGKCFLVNVVVGMEIQIEQDGVVDLDGGGAAEEAFSRDGQMLELCREKIVLLSVSLEVSDRLDNRRMLVCVN